MATLKGVTMNEPWNMPKVKSRVKPWVLEDYLTDYQKEAWKWSTNRNDAMLWWACGAGKTLAALLWLILKSNDKKLVVTRAPAKNQWKFQAAQYTDLKANVLTGFKPAKIGKDVECVIISWEMLPHWWKEILCWSKDEGLAVVWDELHKGKDWKRKEKYVSSTGYVGYRWKDNRAAAAARLSNAAKRRLGLTATPIRDRRSDLWAQLDLVYPGEWGSNWDFIHRYCDAKPGEYGGLDTTGTSNCDELKGKLSDVAHTVAYAEMAKSLPAKRRQQVYLPPEDQNRPVGFKAEFKRMAKKGKQAQFEMQLLEAASRKHKWIAETVAGLVESGQKVTVFTGRRKDCEKLAKAIATKLKKLKGSQLWSGHGGNSLADRQQMVKEYAEYDGPGVLVGTTDAFGEAIDGLQNTDTAIFALLPWTPGQITQAEGRFSRQGSTRPVLISYVIAEGTVDERVADVLLAKLEDVQDTLDDEEAGGVARTLSGQDDEEAILEKLFNM